MPIRAVFCWMNGHKKREKKLKDANSHKIPFWKTYFAHDVRKSIVKTSGCLALTGVRKLIIIMRDIG